MHASPLVKRGTVWFKSTVFRQIRKEGNKHSPQCLGIDSSQARRRRNVTSITSFFFFCISLRFPEEAHFKDALRAASPARDKPYSIRDVGRAKLLRCSEAAAAARCVRHMGSCKRGTLFQFAFPFDFDAFMHRDVWRAAYITRANLLPGKWGVCIRFPFFADII